ncbi:hypothetical protein B7712_04075 [Streptococcus oralis subsp. oralis]|uniref:Uncharacterized protein n=2 Tax=Streptococcus oralis TaxID=1303 RepID=A0A1X1GLE9_STROR|nr:hypothetical protein B7723_09825 [Streptococcus oralis subsp. oralis]ORO71840.1 hypothetical protein B7712_04075 [Streptococcus oralis subsp. oralis]
MLPYFIRFRTKQYEKDGFPNGSVWYADKFAGTMRWVNAGAEGEIKGNFKTIYGADIAYIDVKDNYPIHLRRMELDGLKKADRLLW